MSELLVVETKASAMNRLRAELVRSSEQGRALERELKTLDPQLRVVFVGDIPPEHFSPGMVRNRWHILKEGEHENQLDHYLPIVGPGLEYREPELRIVEDMKKADLWRDGALERLFAERERQVRAKEAEATLKKEQIADEFAVAFRAAKRVKGDEKLLKEAAPK